MKNFPIEQDCNMWSKTGLKLRPGNWVRMAQQTGWGAVKMTTIGATKGSNVMWYSSTNKSSTKGTGSGGDITGTRSSEVDGKKRVVTVNRELPDPFKSKYDNTKYFVTYGIGVLVSCVIIFNYEKTTSPILNSVFYVLRRDAQIERYLGEDIQYKSSWPWISGELNTVTGEIDIHFSVKGDKGAGEVYFKATRPSKSVPFKVHHWYLVTEDGARVDLTHINSIAM